MRTNLGSAPTKEQKEMIEEFQCPGCVAGMDVKCGAFKLHAQYGFTCLGHVPGTVKMGGGSFCLGLPKGFDKVGDAREKITKEPYIRLWGKGTKPDWDKLNVAVWAQEKEGYLYVRTFSPRINKTYVDVIAGGTMAMVPGAVDVADFKGEID